jgi:U32 family peptidase
MPAMELLAPAGNIEKLKYAYLYGADAAYIGIRRFSLRQKADNFHEDEHLELSRIKGNRKLFGALNIFYHEKDIQNLKDNFDYLALYPLDGLIVTDLGAAVLLKKHFPHTPLHLSTQANCLNAEAARVYRDLGFTRIILGREAPLADISRIKEANPDLEIEVFVHGAMCLAYSGRCFLSRYMADRSGNQGHCSHSCRWNYRVLEEAQRPGEYYPVEVGEGFTTILSSKDLCMIDHLSALKEAGVDSVKIEGRMKSLYYTAVITRAYRKALDALNGVAVPDLDQYREELFKVSHREFSTGFYFGTDEIEAPTMITYQRSHLFLGIVVRMIAPGRYEIDVKNKIYSGELLEVISPHVLYRSLSDYTLRDGYGNPMEEGDHGKPCLLDTDLPLQPGDILRKRTE